MTIVITAERELRFETNNKDEYELLSASGLVLTFRSRFRSHVICYLPSFYVFSRKKTRVTTAIMLQNLINNSLLSLDLVLDYGTPFFLTYVLLRKNIRNKKIPEVFLNLLIIEDSFLFKSLTISNSYRTEWSLIRSVII